MRSFASGPGITDVGILFGRSRNGHATGSAPIPGEWRNEMICLIQMKGKKMSVGKVQSLCFRVSDTQIPAPKLSFDTFSLEWCCHHGQYGQLQVHIPFATFEQAVWNKNVAEIVRTALNQSYIGKLQMNSSQIISTLAFSG